MGANVSRRSEPEVHVVVVQSQENGQVDAKVVRNTYRKSETNDYCGEYSEEETQHHLHNRYTARHSHSHSVKPQASSTSSNSIPKKLPSRVFKPLRLSSPSSSSLRESIPDLVTPSNIDLENQQEHHGKRRSVEFSPPGDAARTTFELFRTYDGEEYTVYMREDGKKFYVDFEEQKWRYFPTAWEKRGYFLAINYDPYENAGNREPGIQFSDSRSGEFIHPTKGKLVTYLRQEMQNILYFLDENSGAWLPMPLNWERHIPNVTNMIEKVQRACPHWKDTRAIVALLRQCNYSVEDCIATYTSLNDDGVLDTSEHSGRDMIRAKLEKQLGDIKRELNEMIERNKEIVIESKTLRAKHQELEMENRMIKRQNDKKSQDQTRIVYKKSSTLKPSHINRSAILYVLQEEASTLKMKVSSLCNVALNGISSYRAVLDKFTSRMSQMLCAYRIQLKEISEVRALYQREALQRKLLYNEVQELRGNIRVFCRCRFDDRSACSLKFDSATGMVVCCTAQGRKKAFDFERVFSPYSTQEEVFQDTKPIITSCVDGYNVCIIAYGQTGAGKTYTMMGTRDQPGVNIRSMKELFKLCKDKTKVKYTMKVSIVEVYNEAVFDLLISPNHGHQKLQIVKKGKENIVQGLSEIEVRTMDDVMMVMEEGELNRTVADTKMNTNSSRSHQVLMLRVEGYDRVSKTTTHGRLTLVDLAGSERISRSEATGIRLVEAAAINKSLSALGQVFSSIRNSALHIPYRNSKLTYLLQPSIGGDSKVCVFVNISPLASNMAETISSLEFGQNVRQVELGQAQRHVTRS